MPNDMTTAKLAVSIPPALLREVEVLRKRQHMSRSAVIQIGLRAWVDAQRHGDRVRAYVKAYEEQPESDAEVAATAALVTAVVRSRRKR